MVNGDGGCWWLLVARGGCKCKLQLQAHLGIFDFWHVHHELWVSHWSSRHFYFLRLTL